MLDITMSYKLNKWFWKNVFLTLENYEICNKFVFWMLKFDKPEFAQPCLFRCYHFECNSITLKFNSFILIFSFPKTSPAMLFYLALFLSTSQLRHSAKCCRRQAVQTTTCGELMSHTTSLLPTGVWHNI